jgi:hypothetical protein
LQLGDFALPLAMREYMPSQLVSGAGIVRLRGAETGQIGKPAVAFQEMNGRHWAVIA